MPVVTEYFGSHLSAREYWLAEMGIHEAHREDEAGLRELRWFDYRHMLPAQATYLFAAQYRFEYIEAYKRTVDIRTAHLVSPFSPEDVFKSSELVSMWLARREADRIGCKYDFYLRTIFERFPDRGWRNLPRPNQLYAEELVLDIEDFWKRRCREVLQLADAPFFFADRYVAHPDQDAYHTWVVGQIKQREHKHLTLARVLKNNILPLELAGQEFGVDVLNRAVRFAACA